jgi:hypothetical protein
MSATGYGDIKPISPTETGFYLVVQLVSASLYSIAVGVLSSMVRSTDAATTNYQRKMDQLNTWMNHRHISPVKTNPCFVWLVMVVVVVVVVAVAVVVVAAAVVVVMA